MDKVEAAHAARDVAGKLYSAAGNNYDAALVAGLEANGWTYTPPKPVLPVVSEEAYQVYLASLSIGHAKHALAAAFKVMLRENMEANGIPLDKRGAIAFFPDTFYRLMTGEEWPK